MILSHEEGLNKLYSLRTQFSHELELICLNSEFMDISKKIIIAQELALQYPNRVLLKESEFHEKNSPYYEISIFCNTNEVKKFTQLIQASGLDLDLIHDNQ